MRVVGRCRFGALLRLHESARSATASGAAKADGVASSAAARGGAQRPGLSDSEGGAGLARHVFDAQKKGFRP